MYVIGRYHTGPSRGVKTDGRKARVPAMLNTEGIAALLNQGIRPAVPVRSSLGIGLIGAGGVVEYGHMPAYRQAGLSVVAVASRRRETAEAFAKRWAIPHAMADWQRLIEMPEVQVLDVSYPFDEDRLDILRAAAAAGKHVLMQKPLAHTPAAAREMVDIARRGGIRLAVNQNARWCPQYRAARVAIAQGWLGDVHLLQHEMQNNQDSAAWFNTKWYARQERFQLMEYAVHHLDLMRFWTGTEPVSVKAGIARKAGQVSRGELIASVLLEFPGQTLATLIENNAAWPDAPIYSRFRIEGSEGMLCGYAMGDCEFRIRSSRLSAGEHLIALEGSWFPGAFAGTMGDLLLAIEENRAPTLDAADNLRTLDLVFRAYASAGSVL